MDLVIKNGNGALEVCKERYLLRALHRRDLDLDLSGERRSGRMGRGRYAQVP